MNRTRSCLISITLNTSGKLKVKPDKDQKLGFGRLTTDYMFNLDYTRGKGWHDARIEPYQPLQLDPATLVLHYGQGIFEGLKAYRTKTNKIQLFRPQANMKRMNQSCKIIQMPSIDEKEVLDAITKLVEIEKDWVPSAPGATLYIRPTIIATDPFLGVRAGDTYRLFVILSPVDAYYPEGFNPVKIFVTKDYVRAVRGGLGAAKTMANYAASLGAGELAHQLGYSQVLWLDGIEQKYIEEVGSMNIFFVINNVLTTPVLNGSILAGVTRDSVLTLGKQWGMKVEERRISLDEILESYDKGTLTEIFGTGTAAVISPVKELRYGDRVIKLGEKPGPVAQRFYDDLQAIQFGQAPDTNGWIHPVC